MGTRRFRTFIAAVGAGLVATACASDDGVAPSTASSPTTIEQSSTTSPPTTATAVTTTMTVTTTVPTTTSTTASPATTTSTTSTTTTTTEEPEASSTALIDLDAATFAGWPDDVDDEPGALVERLTDVLGEPTADTDWRPMPPKLACTGNLDYRAVHWGDVRVVLERADEDAPGFVESWSVGDARPGISPARVVSDISPASGVTTIDGVGIGDPAALLDPETVFESGANTLAVPGVRAIVIETDDDGRIIGFAGGRNDCLGLDIAALPCDRPVPVFTLPNGEPTGEVSIDAGIAYWGVSETTSTGDNLISENIGGIDRSDDIVGLAYANIVEGRITASDGTLTVGVVPVGDLPGGASQAIVFDTRTDCIRQFFIGPGLDADELETYITRLIAEWNPKL